MAPVTNNNVNVPGGLAQIDGAVEANPLAETESTSSATSASTSLTVGSGAQPNVAEILAQQGDVPELDDVDPQMLEEVKVILESNLEALIERLRNDELQVQSENSAKRLEGQKGQIKANKEKQLKQIEANMKKLDEAAKKMKMIKALTIAMAVFGVLLAALTGGIIAAIVAALIAAVMIALEETGVMEKMTKAIAEGLEKSGMNRKTAKIWATVLTVLITIVASVAGGAAGNAVGKAIGKAVTAAAKEAIKNAIKETVKSAVQSAVKDATAATVKDAVKEAVKEAVEATIKDAVKESVKKSAQVLLKSGVEAVVEDAVKEVVKEAIEETAKSVVNTAVREALVEGTKEIVKAATQTAMREIANAVVQNIAMVGKKVDKAAQLFMIGASVDVGRTQYKLGLGEADLKAFKAYFEKLKQMLAEGEEDLEQLIQLLQDSIAAVAELLSSVDDNKLELNNEMASMA